MPDLAAAGRPPGEAELPLLDGDALPIAGPGEVAPHHPPDVVAGGVQQLEFQVVRRRRAPDPEGDLVVGGQVQVEAAPRDGPAGMPLEIELEPCPRAAPRRRACRRGKAGAAGGDRREGQPHALGRRRLPAGARLRRREVVESPHPAGGARGCRRRRARRIRRAGEHRAPDESDPTARPPPSPAAPLCDGQQGQALSWRAAPAPSPPARRRAGRRSAAAPPA